MLIIDPYNMQMCTGTDTVYRLSFWLLMFLVPNITLLTHAFEDFNNLLHIVHTAVGTKSLHFFKSILTLDSFCLDCLAILSQKQSNQKVNLSKMTANVRSRLFSQWHWKTD